MPDINTMKQSRYLKKEDCGAGILLTIKETKLVNVAMQGEPAKNKWCIYFLETEKPYVSNARNRQRIAIITGSTNTDNWPGFKVVLYNDPSVEYGGNITGGIAVRAPKNQNPAPVAGGTPVAKPAPAPALAEDVNDDDMPF